MDKSKWYFNSVFYQLFPQTFLDTNNDGIGDLEGMISKLDYLQSLGIDAIWPNSLWLSYLHKDGNYDIVDHKAIDPRYGDLRTYDRFISEAHKRNIKVLGEMNFGATSEEHPWFKESRKMEKNRYSKWYVWTENPQLLGVPIGWMGVPRGAWMVSDEGRYDSYFIGIEQMPHQPWLNYGFPGLTKENGSDYDDPDLKALRKELKDIVRFFLDRGVDGFRVDVAGSLIIQEHGIHENVVRFWNEIRDLLDSYDRDIAYIVEEWDPPVEVIAKCRFNGAFFISQTLKLLCSPVIGFNLPFEFKPEERFFSPEGGDITWFVEGYFKAYDEVIRHGGIINMVSGCHDIPRMSQACKKDEVARTFFALLLTYPTAPFIYYGDEIGMRYWEKLPSKEGSGSRGGSRTPMQWNDKKNAGFSSADSSQLYFPVNPDYRTRNVEKQEALPGSILNTVKKLIALRKSNPSLGAFANIRHLHLKKGDKSYIYCRYGEGDAFVIALNPSDTSRTVTIELSGKEEELRGAQYLVPEICSEQTQKITVEKKLIFQLPRNFFSVYRVS